MTSTVSACDSMTASDWKRQLVCIVSLMGGAVTSAMPI